MNVDPNFAEKLMSTFYAGGGMSEFDYNRCQNVWEECNNDRSKVLKEVVKLCGDIDTPQTRYLRALAWSFNRVEFSKQRIDAIKRYLNNKLYKSAYENLVLSIEKGIKYCEKVHIMTMLQYMAQAYCHLKMYDKEEETYLKIYDLGIIIPNGCVSLAKFYSKRDQMEKAIELLKKEKKTLKYITNNKYREPIDKYLDELEKKQKGINKHFFSGYDSYPDPFLGPIDNPRYCPELEIKIKNLREKYKSTFDYHRKFLEEIDYCEARLKDGVEVSENKEKFNTYCLSDINLFPKIMNYYKEFNTLGFEQKYEYADNKNSDYPIFRKLIIFYEKEGKVEDAIKLCNIAINYGITKYLGKISMKEKAEKLSKIIIEKEGNK